MIVFPGRPWTVPRHADAPHWQVKLALCSLSIIP
jgi:hypothetical protein